MLKASPPPRDFETRSAAYHFGPEAGEVRYTLVAEIPLGGLSFAGKGGTRKAHFSVLAVVRDASGAVREHFAQDSPVEVPEKSLEALKLGNGVFTRSFTLPPDATRSRSWSSTRRRTAPRSGRASSSSRPRARGSLSRAWPS